MSSFSKTVFKRIFYDNENVNAPDIMVPCLSKQSRYCRHVEPIHNRPHNRNFPAKLITLHVA